MAELTAALAAHPERAALQNNVGATAYEEGRLDDAVAALERARVLDPSDSTIALNLGRAYLHAHRTADAIRTLEAAVALEEPSYFAHRNLAEAYAETGDGTRAEIERARARAIRPEADASQR
jgi:predicted Zn-dependent protease